jgi:hypothetical protein
MVSSVNIVEALSTVVRRPLAAAYGPPAKQRLAIYRPLNLTTAEQVKVMLKANLCCKRSKCFFGVKEIVILGHVVSSEGVWMHRGRIDAVLDVPFPRNAKELRRFWV